MYPDQCVTHSEVLNPLLSKNKNKKRHTIFSFNYEHPYCPSEKKKLDRLKRVTKGNKNYQSLFQRGVVLLNEYVCVVMHIYDASALRCDLTTLNKENVSYNGQGTELPGL